VKLERGTTRGLGFTVFMVMVFDGGIVGFGKYGAAGR
jgi:hypothetical protein